MLTHSIRGVECAREVRAAWRALFLPDAERAGDDAGVNETSSSSLLLPSAHPCFSADFLKKCALIALHSPAEEGRGGENGCHAPDLGDEWKLGCPKSPTWETEGEAWSEEESMSSSDSRDDNVCNEALHLIGLHGLGDKVSL